MGECGCGNMCPEESIRIGNRILATEIYEGCPDCGDEFMVVFNLFTLKEAKHWDVYTDDKFEVNKWGYEKRELPLFSVSDLAKAMEEKWENFKGYENISDFMHDFGLEIVRRAFELKRKELGRK